MAAPAAAAMQAGGSLIGGVMGMMERKSAQEAQMRLIQQSVDDLQAIGVPPVEAQQIALEKLRSAGELTPELEQAFQQQNSGLLGIETDPRLKEAQMNALSELQGIGQSGGMRLSDQAAAQGAMDRIQSQERGSREAIAQDLREKSRFGGGDELAMKLANQQNSAQNANQVGLGLAGQAQQNALNAIMQAGNLGGSMQQQSFNQQSQQQAAQDAINRFNSQNSQEVAMRNANAKNEAQGWNLNNKQNIMNQNTGLSNQEQVANKSLLQKQFENQLTKAGAVGDVRNQQATSVSNYGKDQAAMYGKIGQGVGQAGAAFGNSSSSKTLMDDEKDKEGN